MRLIDADRLLYDEIQDIHGDIYMVVHAPEIDRAPIVLDKEKILEELTYQKEDAENLAAKYDEAGDIVKMDLVLIT